MAPVSVARSVPPARAARVDPPSPTGAYEAVDPDQALAAARAAGLKIDIHGSAVRCPAIAPATGKAQLAATGALAPLAIDIDAFLRAGTGIPEAIALLGTPVLCFGSLWPYLDMHLAPRIPKLHAAELETEDGKLLGVSLEFEPAIAISLAPLAKRFGPSEPLVSLHGPGGEVFKATSAAFEAQLIFKYEEAAQASPRVSYKGTKLRLPGHTTGRIRSLLFRRWLRTDAEGSQ